MRQNDFAGASSATRIAARTTAGCVTATILLRFDDMEAVEAYRAHEIHRKYYELYLKPMLDKICVYNFEVPVGAAHGC